ncbi:TPM domain-containing protein [Carboxylicivirga linearis]|uniref:TPM domain-containing protein n=1 Tax=Carboxylicivirga linearis TaxID=1628157 RepID=A0ABS5JV37_9BACT|nr:TPM domain-containing protein [Carboxylicivirga linearis]MBS2098774.1 TPM domain-containing protein [Carboxylicivirga linearis]
MNPAKFFNQQQKMAIQNAIHNSELKTSGEIRVHIENHCEAELLDRATEVFHVLQMHETERRNGVLIYLALEDKKVAIIGDKGINEVSPDDYWQNEIADILNHFKNGEFDIGIIQAINKIGDKLIEFFPIEKNDVNELSDEISFYNN